MGSEPEETRKPKRKKVRTRPKTADQGNSWIVILILLGVVVLGGAGGLVWFWKFKGTPTGDSGNLSPAPSSAKDLPKLLADLDANEPGWKIDGLEAKRKPPSPGQNSAEPILAAKRIMGRAMIASEQVVEIISSQPPEVQFNGPQLNAIRGDLQNGQAGLSEAYKVAAMPFGRYQIKFAKDGISTLLPHAQDARGVALLFQLDAAIRAQQGDSEGATRSFQAMMNVSRSFWDEPMAISQLVRIAIREQAIRSFERTLAQGKPTEQSLAPIQKLLNEDASQNLLLVAAQGERAMIQSMMTALESGELTTDTLVSMMAYGNPSAKVGPKPDVALNHAWLLWNANRFVDMAKLPYHEQRKKVEELSKLRKNAPDLAQLLMPAMDKIIMANHRSHARLSCTAAAIAAERYRMKNGRWPDSLNALVPEQMEAIPNDPYDGQSLRLGKHSQGIVIYSVGPDLKDNQGTIDNKDPEREGTDIGFRLWDESRRHQPPR